MYEIKIVETFAVKYASLYKDGILVGHFITMRDAMNKIYDEIDIFLIICLWRASRLHFTMWKQVGFKSAVWYWHFVDVVWIFLFIVIYVWGGLSLQ